MSLHITLIGGDMRYVRLASLLAADRHTVCAYGMDDMPPPPPVRHTGDPSEALRGADCVVLPIPMLAEGDALFTPLSREALTFPGLLDRLLPGQLVMAGRVPPSAREQAVRRGIVMVDFLDREDMAVANAVPTAEGAIQIAMEELPITLHGSRCLIIGFGRIGKVLAGSLAGLGAHVTVSARKAEDFAWIAASGYAKTDTRRLGDGLGQYDAVFNTVPSLILQRHLLERLKPGCLCVDLASKPGGVDFAAAADLGINCIWALSLPGKVAPHTSGDIIRTSLYSILEERGVLTP